MLVDQNAVRVYRGGETSRNVQHTRVLFDVVSASFAIQQNSSNVPQRGGISTRLDSGSAIWPCNYFRRYSQKITRSLVTGELDPDRDIHESTAFFQVQSTDSTSEMATNGTGPTVAEMAAMTTEERMSGMEHSEVRYFTR